MTYKEGIIEALKKLGGHAYLRDIYHVFEQISGDMDLPPNYKSVIRATLERNSADSIAFDGRENLFYSVDGLGNGHWGLLEAKDTLELTQDDDGFSEGKLLLKKHLQRERNPRLISEAKKRFVERNGRLFCEVCGFDFEEAYGDLGKNFIEAHHTKPVSEMAEGETTKVEDIVMLCSNCHSMIHRKKPWLDKERLKVLLKSGGGESR